MFVELDDECALAVGRKDRVRDDTAHVDGVDTFTSVPLTDKR